MTCEGLDKSSLVFPFLPFFFFFTFFFFFAWLTLDLRRRVFVAL